MVFWPSRQLALSSSGESFDQIDENHEFKILTFHVVGLSRVVLRKHRLINFGWLLTSIALLSLLGAITSYAASATT